MKRTLIAALAIGLMAAAAGCDDSDTTTTDASVGGHGGGGAGGSTTDASSDATVSDAGGTGGGAAGAIGTDANDDVAPVDAISSDDGGDASTTDTAVADSSTDAVAVDWTMCGSGSKPGVSVTDFCSYYMSKCTFDSTGGAVGMERFKSQDECVAKYTGYTDTVKSCTAYHLCVAGSAPGNVTTHCPHPSGGGGNPCQVP